MYKVFGKNGIQISRGDYALIPIKVLGAENGETIIFSVASELDPDEPVIEKEVSITCGVAYIPIASEDTAKLESGRYLWDATLPDFWGEGKRHTPTTSKVFQIVGVSHRV